MGDDDTDDPAEALPTVEEHFQSATVLVVDDEEATRESYDLYLDAEGYDVRTAANGGEALVELTADIDVVLLDRRMPGMSGDEVLEHIEDLDEDCRVVMVTAVDADRDILEMALDDYLTKPVSKDQLVETVEQLLLFDRYESLLYEYHALNRKYATLQSTGPAGELAAGSELSALEERREAVRSAIEETIERFTDEEIRDVFRDAHGTLG